MPEDKSFNFEEAIELLKLGSTGFKFKNSKGIVYTSSVGENNHLVITEAEPD